jgi:outer membrane immunogenic protein
MIMTKILASLALAAALAAPPALAEDAAGPAAGPVADWSGPKLTANMGFARHDARWSDLQYDWYGGSLTNSYQGTTYGVAVGWDFQSGRGVLGAELSWDGSTMSNTVRYSDDVEKTDQLQQLWMVRGRAGVTFDKALLFVTGGLAQGKFRHEWIEDNDVPDSWPFFGNAKFGWTAGLGLAYQVGERIAIQGELVRTHILGKEHTNPIDYTMDVDETVESFRLGATWRF